MKNKMTGMEEDHLGSSCMHSLQLGSYIILFRLRFDDLTFQGCDPGFHVRLPVQGSISSITGWDGNSNKKDLQFSWLQ